MATTTQHRSADPYTSWLDDAAQMETHYAADSMRPVLALSALLGVMTALAVFL